MPTPAIKICGVSTAETLEAVIAARADYVGFVFYPRSPRNVTSARAAELGARGSGRITRVGLFVDPSDAEIAEAVAAAGLEILQLHGHETPARAAQIKAMTGLPVWKAVSVACADDVSRGAAYADAVDLILFDAKTPKGTLPGGMGLTFDWSLLAQWKNRAAWGLAGGLTPGNVAEAVRLTGAPLVDTSSGVESAPGIKDIDRISQFAAAVRSV